MKLIVTLKDANKCNAAGRIRRLFREECDTKCDGLVWIDDKEFVLETIRDIKLTSELIDHIWDAAGDEVEEIQTTTKVAA